MSSCDAGVLEPHSISFPGYLHDAILQCAIEQKQITGEWPRLDAQFEEELDSVFSSANIHESVQCMAPMIEAWRARTFTVKAASPLGSSFTRPQRTGIAGFITNMITQAIESAPLGICRDRLDPFYVWSLKVATRFFSWKVTPAEFRKFVDAYVQNLYGGDFNVVSMAVLLPTMVGPHVDTYRLTQDWLILAQILREEADLAKANRSQFGAGAEPVLRGYALQMYKICVGKGLTKRGGKYGQDAINQFRSYVMEPAPEQLLENMRYLATTMYSSGLSKEAIKEFKECEKLLENPSYSAQATPTWMAKFYSGMTEIAIETHDTNAIEGLLASSQKKLNEVAMSERTQSYAEALALHADNLMLVKQYKRAEQFLIEAKEIFCSLDAPFWKDHCLLDLSEIARDSGDLAKAETMSREALFGISKLIAEHEPYWTIANQYQARLAASKGDNEGAKAFYLKAVELKVNGAGAHPATVNLLTESAEFFEKNSYADEALSMRRQIEDIEKQL